MTKPSATPSTSPVAVTGASGYLASWVVHHLLEQGYTVHATVRDPLRADRVQHLRESERASPGTLELFAADLLKPKSFDQAFSGCSAVIHTASPFQVAGLKDAQAELVTPALQGTENVLAAVGRCPTVGRVVVTSSVASMYGDAVDMLRMTGGMCTEADWNTSSSLSHQPYSYSKTVAEQAAWRAAEEQDRYRLVTINPSFIIGPSLSARTDSTSVDFVLTLANGKVRLGAPDLCFGLVDVRDVAKAHVLALTNATIAGRTIVSNAPQTILEMGARLRRLFPRRLTFPRSKLPIPLLYIFGPFLGLSWPVIRKNAGYPVKFDNRKSIDQLGLGYRPLDETFADHIRQLEDMGLLS